MRPVGSLPADRQDQLRGVKLAAVVAAQWGADDSSVRGAFPAGATLRRARTGWVLCDDPQRVVGGALAWARSTGVEDLHLVVESDAGSVARRASHFTRPPRVWRLTGRTLTRAPVEPPAAEAAPPAAAWPLATALTDAGATVVAEHGVLLGEVLGLEVARVVPGPDGPVIELGVGRHDRDAHREVDGGAVDVALLRRVVAEVGSRRVAEAPSHPANTLGPERWLRSVVTRQPALVGAAGLEPVSPPTPRPNLRAAAVAPAVGSDPDGRPLVVVCSTGIHPELVPEAAEVRARQGGSARLVLTMPARDDHAVTRDLAARLVDPAEVRPVPDGWRTYPG